MRILSPALVAVLALANFAPSQAADEIGAERAFRVAREYTVRVRTVIETPLFGETRGAYQGAGFLVDAPRGWILTNAHVAGRSPSEIEVAFANQDYQPAHKVYVDPFADIAILALDHPAAGRQVARLDRTTPAVVGEPVGAFGHPMGFAFTGTRGIVSATTDRFGPDLIQIDATVDHGNSGGPVISLRDGRILGIATAMMDADRHDRLNFATPISEAQSILALMRRGQDPSPPMLGFALLQDEENRRTLRVGVVFDSTRWALRPGDHLIRIEGVSDSLRSMTDLIEGLRGRRTASLLLERNHARISVAAHPMTRPSILALHGIEIDGALIAPLTFDDDLGTPEPARLTIHSVDPASDAQELSLSELDQLWTVDGRRFQDLDSLAAYVQSRPGVPLNVVIRRSSPDWDKLHEYHARVLPNKDVKLVPAPRLEGSAAAH